MKTGLIILFCVSTMAQGIGRGEAWRPWLEGRFSDAEQNFAQMRRASPVFESSVVLWQADYEIERARYSRAASLIDFGKRRLEWQSANRFQGRQAKLLLAVGQFAEAQKAVLGKSKWDGKDVGRLRLDSVIDFVTLGEVALAKGGLEGAIAALEKARRMSGKASSLYGPEWVRANDDIAIADLGLGSLQAASEAASAALSAAAHEWGTGSIPAMDSLDALGLVQISQGAFPSAEESLARALAWREGTYGTYHPKTADSYIHTALLCCARDQYGDAVRLLERALQIQKATSIGPNGRWALALLTGAEIYAKAGQIREADSCYESALPILEPELGPDAPRLKAARQRYNELRGMPKQSGPN